MRRSWLILTWSYHVGISVNLIVSTSFTCIPMENSLEMNGLERGDIPFEGLKSIVETANVSDQDTYQLLFLY